MDNDSDLSSTGQLSVQQDGPLVTVTLNRPERRNAMTYAAWAELGSVFCEISRSDARVVVLTGAGSSFCAGADLAGTDRAAHPRDQLRMVAETCVALHRMPQPTVARVLGHAAGAGANLALGCDLVIAADNAVFHENFVQRGLSVDFGGSWLLPRLVGARRAAQILLTGASVPAASALAWGMVTEVVPVDQLDDAVAAAVRSLVIAAPIAVAQTKALLSQAATAAFADAVDAEVSAQVINRGTADAAEGAAAFLERRSPRFTGR